MPGVGGAEWFVILSIIVMLFVPSAAFFAVGYFVGKRSAGQGDGTIAPVSKQSPASGAPGSDVMHTERGDSDD